MDEIVPDSPTVRRRQPHELQASLGHDSEYDSGYENCFSGDFETIATLPLRNAQQSLSLDLRPQRLSSTSQHVTQATQLIGQPATRPSVVQVAASSPLKPPPVASPRIAQRTGGILANAMAPPGTAFRLPPGVTRPPPRPEVIDLSDGDGPTYLGSSSDEDTQVARRGDIKPATFIKRSHTNATREKAEETCAKSNNRSKLDTITSRSLSRYMFHTEFNPPPIGSGKQLKGSSLTGSVHGSRNEGESTISSSIPGTLKRSADIMANAYGSSRPPKQARQTGPSPAKPVLEEQDMKLEDIEDYHLRQKVKRIQDIYPHMSVLASHTALIAGRGDLSDTMNSILLAQERDSRVRQIDLTLSDDELNSGKLKNQRPPAKQQVKAPTRTIQEKWSSTQAISRSKSPARALPPIETGKKKPLRRLVKGRKHSSSPVLRSPVATQKQLDESSESEASEAEPDTELVDNVLNFINTCSAKELADLVSVKEMDAEFILSQKPFQSLDAVRDVRSEASKMGKGTRTKRIGEKVVEKCQDMWLSYETVDMLVKECEALGRPVAEEMKKWGVDIFGKGGELELTSLEDLPRSDQSNGYKINGAGLVTPADDDSEGSGSATLITRRELHTNTAAFISQPAMMSENITLKDYQIVGINWLSLLFKRRLSCILADDMGLGKTCQVIGFLAHLTETGVKGPHLVIVPPATLENWLREFSVFCPRLKVEPYYGSLKERPSIRWKIESNRDIDVIVTTYSMAKQRDDLKWLRKQPFCACVFDEGHMLKNSSSDTYTRLIRIPAQFRLLLTGTPLQNNLSELVSLLAFIMPGIFQDRRGDLDFIFSHRARTNDDNHDALLSAQRVVRARSMLKPFVLRRKKHQVLASAMPKKTHRVEYCELSDSQMELYSNELQKAKQMMLANLEAGKKAGTGGNNIMRLRQAAIHPLLFRYLYTDELLALMSKQCVKDKKWQDSDPNLIFDDMTVMNDEEIHRLCENNPTHLSQFILQGDPWLDSGKVTKLCDLLVRFKANGDRTLVFSQFTGVLNILDYVMEYLGIQFFRFDGQTKVEERQDMIDEFYQDPTISVFLLSTKAGGTGINLACANKVIIFDMSFNPQDDIQAENRAHRVGSTKDVEVIRLVTRGTIEERMFKMGESKLMLDERVAGVGGGEVIEAKIIEDLLADEFKAEAGASEDQPVKGARREELKEGPINELKAAGGY